MTPVNVTLMVVGLALLALGLWRLRRPLGRISELDRISENSRRYESWRGNRAPVDEGNTSGADVMRQMLRREVITWGTVGVVGMIVLIVGFAVR